jgi:hypothetical protein
LSQYSIAQELRSLESNLDAAAKQKGCRALSRYYAHLS